MSRTFYVSRSQDGFILHLAERSAFREFIEALSDKACAATGHFFEYRRGFGKLLEKGMFWAWETEKKFLEIPLTSEQAKALQVEEDDWKYIDTNQVLADERLRREQDIDGGLDVE